VPRWTSDGTTSDLRFGAAVRQLYEATRGVWRVGPRREKAMLALAVYRGIVQEVYRIHAWYPAGTLTYRTRDDVAAHVGSGRWEFEGVVAKDVRDRYVTPLGETLEYTVEGRTLTLTIPLSLLGDPDMLSLGLRTTGSAEEGDRFPDEDQTCHVVFLWSRVHVRPPYAAVGLACGVRRGDRPAPGAHASTRGVRSTGLE
jgi:hypothetical protein